MANRSTVSDNWMFRGVNPYNGERSYVVVMPRQDRGIVFRSLLRETEIELSLDNCIEEWCKDWRET